MMAKEDCRKLEWRVEVNDGSTKRLVPESRLASRVFLWLKGLILERLVLKVWSFLVKAWEIGVAEPKKVIHCVKVGLALTIVSLFYYVRPLDEGFGGNAMWAIMTVVVVFESNVGATFSKSINRIAGTLLAGCLGLGIHWVARHSGEKLEPLVIGTSVFLFASAATYSRFVPSVKARFDYGAMIFILTFSLVSVSGYRVDKLIMLAHQRVATIAIGTCICILISMLFYPIWAGGELHKLCQRNLEKLADSLDGCIMEYFKEHEGLMKDEEDDQSDKREGYKCVLNSKAAEESMANFARWEPAHGRFNFRHPWKHYLKIGASMRRCAYCIENISSCINSDTQAPNNVKKHLEESCLKLTSASSKTLRETAIMMKNMRKSSKMDFLVSEMNSAVLELQETLKSMANQKNKTSEEDNSSVILLEFLDVLPLATIVSLLIETAARIQGVVKAVNELAKDAEFKEESKNKVKQNQTAKNRVSDDGTNV